MSFTRTSSEKGLSVIMAVLGLAFGNLLGRTAAIKAFHALIGRPSVLIRPILFLLSESVGGLGALAGFWGSQKLFQEQGGVILDQGLSVSSELKGKLDDWTQVATGCFSRDSQTELQSPSRFSFSEWQTSKHPKTREYKDPQEQGKEKIRLK